MAGRPVVERADLFTKFEQEQQELFNEKIIN